MLHYYTVYAMSDCGYCARAVSELGELGIDHVLVIMDKSPDFHSLLKNKYDHHTVPLIIKSNKADGVELEFIGGCDDLVARLIEEGYKD